MLYFVCIYIIYNIYILFLFFVGHVWWSVSWRAAAARGRSALTCCWVQGGNKRGAMNLGWMQPPGQHQYKRVEHLTERRRRSRGGAWGTRDELTHRGNVCTLQATAHTRVRALGHYSVLRFLVVILSYIFLKSSDRIIGNTGEGGGGVTSLRCLMETYKWRRASDALKITRLPLSAGPFWGGPNTRAQLRISAPSSCLGISCSWYRGCAAWPVATAGYPPPF